MLSVIDIHVLLLLVYILLLLISKYTTSLSVAIIVFVLVGSLEVKLERSEEKVKKLTSDLKRTSDKLSQTKSERNRREVGYGA